MSEDRDAAFMVVGQMRAALQTMNDAAPKDAEARRHWLEAMKMGRKALNLQWDASMQMADTRSLSAGGHSK